MPVGGSRRTACRHEKSRRGHSIDHPTAEWPWLSLGPVVVGQMPVEGGSWPTGDGCLWCFMC